MNGNRFSVVLLSTNRCNAACDYCFEDRTSERLGLEHLGCIVDKLLDHMDQNQIAALTIHWQGGEAMLLSPQWYQQAFNLIRDRARARRKQVDHGLQTNMLAYGPRWNPVIAQMFGNSVSTSMDFPNLHRKVAGRDPRHYNAVWEEKVRMARAAGIDVKVIAVVNRATLDIGAERFWEYFVDELGVLDFQINTPFPGGATNDVKQGMNLNLADLARFHCDLADIWLERGEQEGVRIGPFDELLNYFNHRDALLPCIWGQNCADDLIAIDASGNLAQCDCWVTSYPQFRFGNILECDSLTELLDNSQARRRFFERPVRLVQGECIRCDYLTLCHGGCPVRTYSVHQTLFEKDPYCHLYKTLFRHLEDRTAGRPLRVSRSSPA